MPNELSNTLMKETKMATSLKKTKKPVKAKPSPAEVEFDSYPTVPSEDSSPYAVAKDYRTAHYYNAKGWVVKVVPAGSMVAIAVFVHGVLVEEGTMGIEDGRDFAKECLARGYKKVPNFFSH